MSLVVSMVVIVFISAVGQILIAGIIPGLIDFDRGLFDAMEVGLAGYPKSVLFAGCWFAFLGQFVSMLSWLVGPLRCLAQLLKHVPSIARLRPEGEHGSALWLLILQTILIMSLGFVFLCTSAAGAYWVLGTISTQLAQILYLVLYCAALRVPGHRSRWKKNRKLVIIFGALVSAAGLVYSFIPPKDVKFSGLAFAGSLLLVDAIIVGGAWCLATAAKPSRRDCRQCLTLI